MIISLQASLGLEFRADGLRLAFVKKFFKEVSLDHYEVIDSPPDLTPEERDSFWSREIARFVEEHKIGKENVWVSLPRNAFLFRFLTLPLSAEENLREVVRYEMDKYVPFSLDDVSFDFVVAEKRADTNNLHILLMVIKKTVLERYLSILQRVGITPVGIEATSSALLNFFLEGRSDPSERPQALLDLSRGGVELNWILNGALRYSRAYDFGADKDPVTQIVEELQNGFRTAFPLRVWGQDEDGARPELVLSGDFISEELVQNLRKADIGDLEVFRPEDRGVRCDPAVTCPPSLCGAVGLALKGLKRVVWDVNLLPKLLQKKIQMVGFYLSFFFVLANLVLLLAWGGSAIIKERLELRSLEKGIDALKDQVLAVEKTQQKAREIAAEIQSLGEARGSEYSQLEILKELSAILPPTVWLTDFRYYKRELQLSGFADSASILISVLDGSSLFRSSEFTAPITRDRDGKESFKIKTQIERR